MLLFIGNELFWWKPWSTGVVWNQEKAKLGRAVLYRPYSSRLPLLWLLICELLMKLFSPWITESGVGQSSSFLSTCEFALLGGIQTILYKCMTNFGLLFVTLLSTETIKQFLSHKRRTDLLLFSLSLFQCVPDKGLDQNILHYYCTAWLWKGSDSGFSEMIPLKSWQK